MTELFHKMTTLEQTYLIIALVSSAILLIIFATNSFGGSHVDRDTKASGFRTNRGRTGFQFVTFKNFAAFFTVFGWTGVSCLENKISDQLTLLFAAIAGLIIMALTSLFFYRMYKLSEGKN